MSQNRRRVADRAITAVAVVTVLVVTGIAAAISYRHCYDLAVRYGETGATARALPLTVDGLVLMCSLVLLDAARRGERAPRLTWGLLAAGIVATMAANVVHGIEHGWGGAIVSAWPAAVAAGSFELLAHLVRSRTGVRETDAPADAYSPASTQPDPHPGTPPTSGTHPDPGTPDSAPETVPAPVPDAVPGGVPAPAPASASEGVPDDVPEPESEDGAVTGYALWDLMPPRDDVPACGEAPQDGRVPEPVAAAPEAVPAPRVPAELLEHAAEVFKDDLADGRVPSIRAIKQQLGVGQTRAREVQAHLKVRCRSRAEYVHA